MPRLHWTRHPTTKGALTHTTVVGITVALVGALHEILPEADDTILLLCGVVVAMAGFAGLYFTVNGHPPPDDEDAPDRRDPCSPC